MKYLGQDAVLAVVRDISDRNQAERERQALEEQMRHAQKLESLGLLAGGIAHDFNNLLVGVMGHSELAQWELDASHPAQENLTGVLDAAERAAGLCSQMLAYSGRGQFIVQLLNINDSVRDITQLLAASLSKKIEMKFELDSNLAAVEADAAQITQLTLNLMTNAAEAIGTEKGSIHITTRTVYCDPADLKGMLLDDELATGSYVVLSIEDTGSGMDEDTVSRIFDPFFTTKFTGRGLGLAAVLGIVRGHRGALRVESEVGKGTHFEMYLPAADRVMAPKIDVVPPEEDGKSEGTLLIVDDEPTVLKVAKSMLERQGFNILTAQDGREAIEVFKLHQKEIKGVILDLTMPELNGRETYLELQLLDDRVPVLIASGFSSDEVVKEFDGGDKVGFVQKPFQATTFCEKVQEMLLT